MHRLKLVQAILALTVFFSEKGIEKVIELVCHQLKIIGISYLNFTEGQMSMIIDNFNCVANKTVPTITENLIAILQWVVLDCSAQLIANINLE